MINFAEARAAMVEGQVRTNDVTDLRIQYAMGTLPREAFVPKGKRTLAYMGEPVPVAEGRTLLDPRSFSKLVQALDVRQGDLALDIACATGYSTAVLASMCDAVVGLESDEALADLANQTLQDLKIHNAAVVPGDLHAGFPQQGPYDVILVNGGVEFVPKAWFEQLAEGGRLGVIVTDEAERLGRAYVYVRVGEAVSERIVFDATPDILPGFKRAKEFVF